ncbi:MAG: hypothetical protein ACT4PV_10795 [Planctomycetaceae bacterium]
MDDSIRRESGASREEIAGFRTLGEHEMRNVRDPALSASEATVSSPPSIPPEESLLAFKQLQARALSVMDAMIANGHASVATASEEHRRSEQAHLAFKVCLREEIQRATTVEEIYRLMPGLKDVVVAR